MQYTEEQKKFILKHNGKMHRRDMQKRMGVSIDIFTSWCIELCGRKKGVNKRKKQVKKAISNEFFEHDNKIVTI